MSSVVRCVKYSSLQTGSPLSVFRMLYAWKTACTCQTATNDRPGWRQRDNPILVQIRAIANSRRDRHSKSKPRISSSTEPVLNAKDIFKAWEAGSGEGRDDTEAAVLRTLYYSNTSRAMQYLYASIPGPLLAPIGC